MKNIVIIVLAIVLGMNLWSCTRPSEPELNNPYDEKSEAYISTPDLNTAEVLNIRALEAWSGGTFENEYGKSIIAKGVCWSLEENPTTDDNCTNDGEGKKDFESHLYDLNHDQLYYIRAYATNEDSTTYGGQRIFKTLDGQINLTTTSIDSITTHTALSGGNITEDGGAEIDERGVCWSTTDNPTTNNNCKSEESGLGSYTILIDGLEPNTTYYVRAYASNKIGIAYGNQKSFKTEQEFFLPEVETKSVSNISARTAESGGNVTYDGNTSITARGVCWSNSNNPTLQNNCTNDGTGIGSFTSILDDLRSSTNYFVRAYATNKVGTAYGNQRSFKTRNSATPRLEFDRSSWWKSTGGNGESGNPFTGYSSNKGYHNSTGFIEYKVEDANGEIHYDVTVSSETNFDFLNIKIDEQRIVHISGSKNRSGSYSVTEGTTIRIEYLKDYSVNNRDDRGYLNSLYITPD